VTRQLEAIVRRYPWQWFQFARFWPDEAVAAAADDALVAARSPQ
jgi:predicted LPLAT superfamily acyltransferase